MSSIDPVDLTAKLVRCPSVTPADGGAQEVLFDLLTEAGFDCAWADRGGIKNLFFRGVSRFLKISLLIMMQWVEIKKLKSI